MGRVVSSALGAVAVLPCFQLNRISRWPYGRIGVWPVVLFAHPPSAPFPHNPPSTPPALLLGDPASVGRYLQTIFHIQLLVESTFLRLP